MTVLATTDGVKAESATEVSVNDIQEIRKAGGQNGGVVGSGSIRRAGD